MQLFDGHNAAIKAVIIQIKFSCEKNSQKLFQATLNWPEPDLFGRTERTNAK